MKSSIVVEINQVRVGIIDPISQMTSYLRDEEKILSFYVGIHDGGEVSNCYGNFYDTDSNRVPQSIDYSRVGLDTRIDIEGQYIG